MGKLELFTKTVARELYKRDPSTKLTAADIRRGGWTKGLESIGTARRDGGRVTENIAPDMRGGEKSHGVCGLPANNSVG